MDLNYISNNDSLLLERIREKNMDLVYILGAAENLIKLADEIKIRDGDFQDLVFRLINLQRKLAQKPFSSKSRIREKCPAKVTFEIPEKNKILNFYRSKKQDGKELKKNKYYCKLCGPDAEFYKKEIRFHASLAHKN